MTQSEEILHAVKSRDTARAQTLLAQHPHLANASTPDGSLLLTAVFHGAKEIAALIHSLRDDLDVHEASTLGDVRRLADLLDRRPELVDQPSSLGMRPLHLAAFFNHLEAVGLLLDRGAAINAYSERELPNIPKNTALHAACAGRAWSVVERLMRRGADASAVDSAGFTPLHHASLAGHIGTVRLLASNGVPLNTPAGDGSTPTDLARRKGHSDVADLLAQLMDPASKV